VTRFVGTPLTGIEFASASSEAFSARVDEDSNPRIRIDAGGRITWSSGAASGDVILERSAADTLSLGSGDTFKTPVIYVDNIEIDPTGATTGQVLKFDGVKFAPAADATGSGGSSNLDDLLDVVIISATTGQFLKFNGTNWVNSAIALDDLSDVVITSPEEFQGLSYNGTSWVNSHIPLVSYVRNAESTTITTGTCVYLFGSTGDHATVKRADNDSDATSSKTIGVAGANIAASQNGPIITRGYVDGIDLSTGYDAGDILWLGEDGGFTKTKPTAPEHIVFIGVVVRATSNGIIYVATQNGYELDELHDVSIASRTSGDFLKYNGTLWVNDQIDLGTDTVGNYMVDVSAGTGVTVTHTPSEGSTATIAIGQAVAATDSPTFAGLTINGPSIVFEGATADSFETTLTVADPTTSDKTVTIPNTTGTLITTGDTGTVTSTMIADSTIVNGDISASAAIALSKLASGTSGQIVVANASGVPTYTTVSGDITISDTGVAAIAANSVALGTDTTGNYVSDVSAGTGVTVTHTPGEGSTATVAIGQAVAATDSPTFAGLTADNVKIGVTAAGEIDTSTGNLTIDSAGGTVTVDDNLIVTGDLTVQGTTTTIETTNLNVEDNIITLNYGYTGTPTTLTSGIEVERGTASNVSIRWNEPTSTWQYTADGTLFNDIGNTSITISDSAPSSPSAGDLWFESDSGKTFVYYDSFWVEVAGGSGPIGPPGIIDDPGRKIGEYYGTVAASTTSLTMVEDRTYFAPIYIGTSTTFDRIGIRTHSTFSGTATVRLGVYNNGGGEPATVRFDAGTVSCTAASTFYPITISQTLPAGWYWLACNSQTNATTNTFTSTSLGINFGILKYPSNGAINFTAAHWYEASVTGAFATAGTLVQSAETPIVVMRTA